jgi:hypothetical protein
VRRSRGGPTGDAIADGGRHVRFGAPVAVHGEGYTVCELSGGSRHGSLGFAIYRFGTDAVDLLQPRSHPASLIHTPEGVRRLGEPHRHLPDPRAESAQGQQDAPHDPLPQGPGQPDGGHVDLQRPISGMRRRSPRGRFSLALERDGVQYFFGA